ncbi:MAG: hypothetical protein LBP25_02375 [Tannerellaceae bacterium]|jgi:hypothetical protein|nr:hypothetical protein [Tannerellaceae bacterium]
MKSINKLCKILLPAVLFFTFSGCEKWEVPVWSHAIKFTSLLKHLKCEDARISTVDEEWNPEINKEISIVGTWKLLLDFSAGDTVDRSCTEVIYSFHADGTVTIESQIKEIASGTFEYSYSTDPYCPLCDPLNPPPNLVIGENKYYCQLSPSWLVTFFVRYWDVDGEIRPGSGKFEKVFHRIN